MSLTFLLMMLLPFSVNAYATDGDTMTNPLESLRKALRYGKEVYKVYKEEFELAYCWAEYIIALQNSFASMSEEIPNPPAIKVNGTRKKREQNDKNENFPLLSIDLIAGREKEKDSGRSESNLSGILRYSAENVLVRESWKSGKAENGAVEKSRNVAGAKKLEDNAPRKRGIDSPGFAIYGPDISSFELPAQRHRDLPPSSSFRRTFEDTSGSKDSADNMLLERDVSQGSIKSTGQGQTMPVKIRNIPDRKVPDNEKENSQRTRAVIKTALGQSQGRRNIFDNETDLRKLLSDKPRNSARFLNHTFLSNSGLLFKFKDYAVDETTNSSPKLQEILEYDNLGNIPRQSSSLTEDYRGQRVAYRHGLSPGRKSNAKGKFRHPRKSTSLAHSGGQRFIGDYPHEIGATERNSTVPTSSLPRDQCLGSFRMIHEEPDRLATIVTAMRLYPPFAGLLRLLRIFISVGRQIIDSVESNKALSCTWNYVYLKIARWINSPETN